MIDYDRKDATDAQIKKIVTERLKQVREEHGANRTAFANSLNCSRNNVYYFESGERMVNVEYLYNLATVYKINPNWVLGLTNRKML